MRAGKGAALLAAAVLVAQPVRAVQPDEILPDAGLEKRARAISAELRCLVCQNQSVDDSDAPLARDLRLLVRERLVHGDSDPDVLRFVVARYGDFVLLRPPLSIGTALLWLGPAAMLFAAGLGLARAARQRRRTPEPLSEADGAELDRLLAQESHAATRELRFSPSNSSIASFGTGRENK